MRKISLFTTIGVVMSTISALVGLILFALFSSTTYYYLDQENKKILTSTALELSSNYFVLADETVQYVDRDSQLSITDLLKSRDLSAVIYDRDMNRIGTFGLFRYIFESQPSLVESFQKNLELSKQNQNSNFSHIELNEETYEIYTIPLSSNNQMYGYLQLAKQYTFLEKLRSLTLLLFVTIVPPIIITVWFLSKIILRKFLQPLENLVKLFTSVSVETLPKNLKTSSHFSETHALVDACNTMIDRLRLGVEKQKHFTAYASHELNTPLTRVTGRLDRALLVDSVQEKDQQIEMSLTEIDSLSEMLQGLFLLLQPQAVVKNRYTTKLSPLLAKLQQEFSQELERKNILFTIECDEHLACKLHKMHLEMLLNNLISNAVKYTPKGGKIRLVVKNETDGLRILVSDTGIGISQEQKDFIFEPFFRTSEVLFKPGVGIGLSLVKQIALTYDLEIDLRSAKDQETEVIVRKIPVA